MRELKIDPELRDLLPPLTSEEYKQLEKNIVENGFDRNFPIMEWQGFIVDGHNRYDICKKHNIEPIIGTLAYKTKEEVMEWMLDIQLGRRNLTPIQKIAIKFVCYIYRFSKSILIQSISSPQILYHSKVIKKNTFRYIYMYLKV